MSNLIPTKTDTDKMDTSSDAAIDYVNAYIHARFDDYDDTDTQQMVRNYTNQDVINAVETATTATFRYCADLRNWNRFDEE